jgi:hypothetical protein
MMPGGGGDWSFGRKRGPRRLNVAEWQQRVDSGHRELSLSTEMTIAVLRTLSIGVRCKV